MRTAVGIDLGTTFSLAAYADTNGVKVIPSSEGGNLIPSVVAFLDSGSRLVGRPARVHSIENPEQTVSSVKRFMGLQKKISVNGNIYTPQEISGFILGKVKKEAEAYLHKEVEKAVITVPAYFNDNQRQATVEAACLAGLEVMRIINEPTAASLAYGLHTEDIHHILVWDLGGGTFDVSILELGQGVFEVKAVNGNTHLGGDDWDQKLMDFLADEINKKFGIDLRKERRALQRLKEGAERAKKELSERNVTEVSIPLYIKDRDFNISLSREKFEYLCKDLMEKIISPTVQALEDAQLTPENINRIILVGGATRMPAVRRLAKEIFGKNPYTDINPDEAVAMGAAIQAGVLTGKINNVTLVDVTPLSLGIETMGGMFTKIIGRNTSIPTSRGQIFTTAYDHQTRVDIHVLQGERALAADNISLGVLTLDEIDLARRGEPQIEVNFHMDSNGILNVTALDLHTENAASIKMSSPSSLSQDRIKKILAAAEIHREDDARRLGKIQARIRAFNMIEGARSLLKEYSDGLDKFQMNEVEQAILRVEKAMDEGKRENILLDTRSLKRLVKMTFEKIDRERGENKTGHSHAF